MKLQVGVPKSFCRLKKLQCSDAYKPIEAQVSRTAWEVFLLHNVLSVEITLAVTTQPKDCFFS